MLLMNRPCRVLTCEISSARSRGTPAASAMWSVHTNWIRVPGSSRRGWPAIAAMITPAARLRLCCSGATCLDRNAGTRSPTRICQSPRGLVIAQLVDTRARSTSRTLPVRRARCGTPACSTTTDSRNSSGSGRSGFGSRGIAAHSGTASDASEPSSAALSVSTICFRMRDRPAALENGPSGPDSQVNGIEASGPAAGI